MPGAKLSDVNDIHRGLADKLYKQLAEARPRAKQIPKTVRDSITHALLTFISHAESLIQPEKSNVSSAEELTHTKPPRDRHIVKTWEATPMTDQPKRTPRRDRIVDGLESWNSTKQRQERQYLNQFPENPIDRARIRHEQAQTILDQRIRGRQKTNLPKP